MLPLMLAAVLNAPAPAEETPAPPKGPQPLVRLVSADADGNVSYRVIYTTYETQTVTRVVNVNGKQVQVAEQVVVPVMKETMRKVAAKDVQAFDTRGKPLEAKDVAESLKKETIVLVSADGRPVDPFFLKIIKEGTVVLVLPPEKGDPTPPPGPPPAPRER
jgi:hypothetical protein